MYEYGTIVAISMVVLGVIGMVVGGARGRPLPGFLLGTFLGPMGVILAALLEPSDEVEMRRIRRRLYLEAAVRHEMRQGPGFHQEA